MRRPQWQLTSLARPPLITGAGRGIGRAVALGRGGAGLHERFNKNYADGALITPEHSAAALLAHLAGDDTGAIWDVSTAPVSA